MTTEAPERKYSLTKIRSGDWLLPSNDFKTFWRIRQYEDGPSFGLLDWERDETFWGIWRWRGTEDELNKALALEAVDEEPDLWEYVEGSYARRHEAIDAALKKET